MTFSIRKIGKRIFIALNLLVALCFITTCLQPFADPTRFWFLGFFSLAFPYCFIILIVFIFFWLAAKIQYTLISILAMAIAWKQIDVLFNVKQQPYSSKKAPGQLRVMSWNVQSLRGAESNIKAQQRNALKILKLVEEVNPDVLCLQEFGQYDSSTHDRNYMKLLKAQGYEHYILSRDYVRKKTRYSNGVAIFSKFPFIQAQKIPFAANPESILYADMLINEDTIRVFTTHLESYKISSNDYRDIQKITKTDDSLYEASLNIYSKMKRAYRSRARQANQIQPLLDESPYPELFTCDLNDVPTSYAYWKLKEKLNDAFAEKGFGVGRTFLALAPTLRIDYIMCDKRFDVTQFDIIQKRYSDHFPIVADLKLKTGVH